jgi:hypothetical protein
MESIDLPRAFDEWDFLLRSMMMPVWMTAAAICFARRSFLAESLLRRMSLT